MSLMDDSVSSSIKKRKGNFSERFALQIYCIIKILPIFAFYMCYLYVKDSSITIIICFVSFLFEGICIKDHLSMNLVGLRFSFEASEVEGKSDQEDLLAKDSSNSGSIIHFYSRPPPFVPQAALSNSFWIGYFLSIIVFFFSGIYCFFRKKITLFFLAMVESFVQIVTVSFYVTLHELKRKEEKKIVRSYYSEEKIEFQLVNEYLKNENK